jgi:hypothetical protein
MAIMWGDFVKNDHHCIATLRLQSLAVLQYAFPLHLQALAVSPSFPRMRIIFRIGARAEGSKSAQMVPPVPFVFFFPFVLVLVHLMPAFVLSF